MLLDSTVSAGGVDVIDRPDCDPAQNDCIWGAIDAFMPDYGYVYYSPEARASDTVWNRMHRFHADTRDATRYGWWGPRADRVRWLAYTIYVWVAQDGVY